MTLKDKKKNALLLIEKQLAPRLGILGGVIILIGICSFIYGTFVHTPSSQNNLSEYIDIQKKSITLDLIEIEKDDPRTLIPENILNFYFVSFVFMAVGTFCIFTSMKRKNQLKKIK